MKVFLVDSNFFIQAHRANYPLDVALSFWTKVKEFASNGSIISIDKVKQEIYKNNDALKQWCITNLPNTFFQGTQQVINEYIQITKWASSMTHHYKQTALNEFLHPNEADAWLIAFALHKNIPLITYERSQPNSKKKIKIPDVCLPFGVSYHTTIDMFRLLNQTF